MAGVRGRNQALVSVVCPVACIHWNSPGFSNVTVEGMSKLELTKLWLNSRLPAWTPSKNVWPVWNLITPPSSGVDPEEAAGSSPKSVLRMLPGVACVCVWEGRRAKGCDGPSVFPGPVSCPSAPCFPSTSISCWEPQSRIVAWVQQSRRGENQRPQHRVREGDRYRVGKTQDKMYS